MSAKRPLLLKLTLYTQDTMIVASQETMLTARDRNCDYRTAALSNAIEKVGGEVWRDLADCYDAMLMTNYEYRLQRCTSRVVWCLHRLF